MPILTSDQFEEIKRLNAERTPGEWYLESPNLAGIIRVVRPGREAGDPAIAQMIYADWWYKDGTPDPTNSQHERNAKFAAACSWAVPALIAEVERLRTNYASLAEAGITLQGRFEETLAENEQLRRHRSLNDEAVERIVPVVETFVQEIKRLQDYILDLPDPDGRHLRFLEQVSGTPTLKAFEDWIGQKQTRLPTIRPSTAENGEE